MALRGTARNWALVTASHSIDQDIRQARVHPAVRAGSRVMVYARLPTSAQTITAVINGNPRTVPVLAGTHALIDRAAAASEIDELEGKLARATGDTKVLRDEIAKRSVAARVISSQTSLLVLETAADYERFGIDRLALTDIMEITQDGLVTRNRKGKAPLEIARPDKPATKHEEMEKRLETLEEDGTDDEASEDEPDDQPAMKSRVADPAVAVPPPKPADAAPMAEPPATELRRPMADRRSLADRDDDGGDEARASWPPKNKPAALQG